MTSQSALQELQAWYSVHCNGDWEHGSGIVIQTLDNPGWLFCVDLQDTELAEMPFVETKENYEDDMDWLSCSKAGMQFSGYGGPLMLERMISIFLEWARMSIESQIDSVS